MDFIAVMLLAIGLAMDAFAVSVCKGLAMKKPSLKSMAIVGLWFGVFQAVMPIIGYFIGKNVYSYISSIDHWIAFILLFLIGANMMREALSDDDDKIDDDIGFKIMLLLAIATSIDALAVGITFALDGYEILVPAIVIGVVTCLISIAGVKIGGVVGDRFSTKAEILGGAILILIGLRILLDHLGVFS